MAIDRRAMLAAMASLPVAAPPVMSAISSPRDPALANWDEFKDAFRGYTRALEADAPYAVQHGYGARVDEADSALPSIAATSLPGAIAKLRRLFMYHERAEWAEELAFGADNPQLRRQLEMADLWDRLLWSVVDDLERLTENVGRA